MTAMRPIIRRAARAIIAAAAVGACAGGARAGEGKTELINGGFERGSDTPAAWRAGRPVPGVEFTWDRETAHGGTASLRASKTVNRYFPIAEWYQPIRHDGTAASLQVSASVKAKQAGKAVIDVQFVGAGKSLGHKWAAYIGAQNAGDPPATHDWKQYSGTVAVPPGAREIRIALQIYGPGTVWFDDVVAVLAQPSSVEDGASRPSESADIAGIPSADLRIDGDAKKRYFMVGPKAGAAPPAEGYKLLVVMPGGDGSAEFHRFVKRIYANALTDDYLVAQPVAPQWSADQAKQVVWPTNDQRWPGMKFSTEQFMDAVVADVRERHKVDSRYVFTLSWSSSGPAAYAISLDARTQVKGSFVAMSIFKPDQLPPLERAGGHAYYILHSPDDFISMRFPEQARDLLRKHGAKTKLVTYAGGHGWHGDVYGNIRRGVAWLEEQVRD